MMKSKKQGHLIYIKILKTNVIKVLTLTGLLALTLIITGCPDPEAPPENGPPSENLLPIPELGTEFIFEGEELNWDIPDHPRIMARPEGIQYLTDNPESELTQKLLESALWSKARLKNEPDYRDAVAPLACAWGYVLSGDETYLETVRGTLDWLLQFPPIVRWPEGANIPFMYQAFALGGVYDLLFNDFSDEDRSRIEKVLRETVYHTLAYKVTEYDKEINFWANDPHANYYVTFHSSAGLVAMVLAELEPDAEALAEHCWLRLQDSMHVFATENGWREGLTYLDFCWGQFACYFFLALERNTDLKPFDHPWFTASIPWSVWGALPDRETVACFGDNEPENYSVGSWIYRLGVITDYGRYRREAEMTAGVVDLAVDLPIFEAMCEGRQNTVLNVSQMQEERGISRHLPGIEWGYIRTGSSGTGWEDENDFYCAFKSGVSGYDHNHLDQGSLILSAYSEVLLSDPGRGGPDIIRQDPALNCLFEAGLGHNTLIVGDGCYMDLKLFPDNPDYFSEPGEFTSREETDEYVQFTTDNSGLYPTEPLTDYRRTFLYIKPGIIEGAELGVLILADRVAFYEDMEHSFLFHTPSEFARLDTGIARFTNNGARLDYFGFCSVPTVDKQERQETTWDIRDSWCYYRSTDGPVRASDWVHVLIPGRTDAPDPTQPTFEMFTLGVKVTWDDYEVMLMIKPGIGWVAGELPM